MNIINAIEQVDALKHNAYSQQVKITWLSRVESMIVRHIVDTHHDSDIVCFHGFDENTEPDTELLAPEPFDELYIRWLEAQIDYANGEYRKYNNAIQLFNSVFSQYRNHYNKTHMPKGCTIQYF